MSNCIWNMDEDGNWETLCDQMHGFIDGGPTENGHVFCPYCGKHIRVSEAAGNAPRTSAPE